MPMTDRDKRTLRIGGIILGVLLVAFLLLKFLGGGGSAEDATAGFSPRATTSAPGGSTGGGTTSGSESPSLAPSPVLVLPVRDPFAIPAGFPVSSSGSTTSGGSTTTGTSTTSGGTTTTSTTTTTTSATTPGGGTRTPSQPSGATETVGGHQVTLIDTFTTNGVEQATVSVDGTVYRPSAGQTFGPNKQYKLQSVSGNCATFLFGDQSFTLCVPQNK
jgi:hypothetical protein